MRAVSLDSRRLIAVSLAVSRPARLGRDLETAARWADLVELRLDLMPWLDLRTALRGLPLPAIVTVRAQREGGAFRGDEEQRLDLLREAMDLGAAAVDIEHDALDRIPPKPPCLRIGSFHDFEAMPADLEDQARAIQRAGVEVVKAVGTARTAAGALAPLRYLRRTSTPSIAIAMGAAGVASRVLALREPSCWLTYAALTSSHAVAPGQIAVDELHRVYRARALGPRTRAIGLLGTQAFDRAIREANAWLGERGLDAVAVPLPAADSLDELLPALGALDFTGVVQAGATDPGALVRSQEGWRPLRRSGLDALDAIMELSLGD